MSEATLDTDDCVLVVARAIDTELGIVTEEGLISHASVRMAQAILFDLGKAGFSVLTPSQAAELRELSEQESA